jgi:hypothetical protein
MTIPAQRRASGGTPERHRTLAEVCDLYFPGITPCALRWMIKRRGYAHSRWGREYRLTDSQVAAIQADMARPARQASAAAAARGPRGARTSKQAGNAPAPAQADRPTERRRRRTLPLGEVEQALAEQLASPLAVTAAPDSSAAGRRES